MKIIIETIPHGDQRYSSVGDWFYEPGEGEEEVLHFKVSELSDWRREALIAVHELVEVLLCRHDGVSQEEVDQFDKKYEADRQPDDDSEPGDSPNAPYVKQHCLATAVERMLAAELEVSWQDYENELGEMP